MSINKKKTKKPIKPLLRFDKSKKHENPFWWLIEEEEEKDQDLSLSNPLAGSEYEKEQSGEELETSPRMDQDSTTVYNEDDLDLINYLSGSDLNMGNYIGSDIDPSNFGYHLDPMEYIRYFKDSIRRAHNLHQERAPALDVTPKDRENTPQQQRSKGMM